VADGNSTEDAAGLGKEILADFFRGFFFPPPKRSARMGLELIFSSTMMPDNLLNYYSVRLNILPTRPKVIRENNIFLTYNITTNMHSTHISVRMALVKLDGNFRDFFFCGSFFAFEEAQIQIVRGSNLNTTQTTMVI